MKRYFILVLIVACGGLFTLAYQLHRLQQEGNTVSDWTLHSYEVIRAARGVYIGVLTLETGARGYLMTADAKFLGPYRDGIKRLNSTLDRLPLIVADSPEQNKRAVEIVDLVRGHAAHLDQQMQAFTRREYQRVTLDDIERTNTSLENIQKHVETFVVNEMGFLQQRRAEDLRQRERYTTVLLTSTILSLIGLLAANAVILRMISSQRAVREKLQESEQRFLLAMQGINDGVFEYRPLQGTVVYSARLKEMLGYTDAEFPDTLESFGAHIHPDDAEACREVSARYFRREIPTYNNVFRMRHKNGGYLWILSRGQGEWNAAGHCTRLIGIYTDITEQKSREEYLARLNNDLEGFTYLASHDLRSPLVNLKGFAGEIALCLEEMRMLIAALCAREALEECTRLQQLTDVDIPEALSFIQSAVDKMDRLTTAIVDLSRIGRRVLRIEAIDMNALVKRSADAIAYQIQTSQAEVEIGDLPPCRSDPAALDQIFGNLLDNAVKYLDPRRKGHITVRGERYWDAVRYIIEDNGRGIPPEEADKVFGMFRRASNAHDTQGVGMGMAYVRAIVHRLGGAIAFTSSPGGGTQFTLTLPVITESSS